MGCQLFVSIPVKYLVYCISFLLLTSLSSFCGLLHCHRIQPLCIFKVGFAETLSVSFLLLDIILRMRQIALHQLYLG